MKIQMDTPGNYTKKWNMEISHKKAKVMIFTDPRGNEKDVFWSINGRDIEFTKSYKYLGVILNTKHSYKAHVDMIVEKAYKCLLSVIKKSREWRGFEPNLLLYLFLLLDCTNSESPM